MPVDCQRSTSGGKGNLGMFIERSPKICAAGLPSAQPDDDVEGSLKHYLLKDKVDALISDAIIPPAKPKPLPPLRRPPARDTRFAGFFGDVAQIVNPPIKTKFQTLVDDLKETSYSSYWKKPLGTIKDPVPMLPEGFDIKGTTFGKETPFHGRLYDLVMPKDPPPDKTPLEKRAGIQLRRNYCKPAFNPDLTFGHRTFVDKRGTYARCCVTDDRIVIGTGSRTIVNKIQSEYFAVNQPRLGTVLAPNNNISNVPKDFIFGKLKPPDNLPECLTYCALNPYRELIRKCLKHLNTLRKGLSTRILPGFFRNFYLNLKYVDEAKCGWLPKSMVYKMCAQNLIRFDPTLIEPLLSIWKAFDGSKIEYKIFVHVINYREPSPEIPKILDVPESCLYFETTYKEMTKLGQEQDMSRMAGIPSGRYLDLDYPVAPESCCRADLSYLPHESDMRSSINPSILTLYNISHRDMYAKREPHVVRRVFESAGIKLDDEKFNALWEEASKLHSQGWVCYETFRRVLGAKDAIEKNKEG